MSEKQSNFCRKIQFLGKQFLKKHKVFHHFRFLSERISDFFGEKKFGRVVKIVFYVSGETFEEFFFGKSYISFHHFRNMSEELEEKTRQVCQKGNLGVQGNISRKKNFFEIIRCSSLSFLVFA